MHFTALLVDHHAIFYLGEVIVTIILSFPKFLYPPCSGSEIKNGVNKKSEIEGNS